MKKSQEELVESKKHRTKTLKHRRVRFDLPVKEKEELNPSSVSVSQNIQEKSSHLLDQVKSFLSPPVEGSLPIAEKATKRQDTMKPSAHLQQETECNLLKGGLPAKETQIISATNAPVLSDTIGCPPKQRSPRTLLSVEKEIVQILAEMQMKATAPAEVHTNNGVTESNSEKNAIPNHLDVNDNEPMMSNVTRGDTGDKQEGSGTSKDFRGNVSGCSENIGSAGSTGNIGSAGSTGNIGSAGSTGNIDSASSTGNIGSASSTGNIGSASSTGNICSAGSSVNIGSTGSSANISAVDNGTQETIKAVETTDRVVDEALSASQIHVQLALKLVMKEEGSSLVLLSPPAVDEASRSLLSLQQGKSVLPQDVQMNETMMEGKGNSQYRGNPAVADNHSSNDKEDSDEIEVVYERRKHVPIPLAVKHEKSTIQQVESGRSSVDRKDMNPSNPAVADIHHSNDKQNSDEIEVVYERRKHGTIPAVVKCETSAVQQEATGHFSLETKDMESLNKVQCEKPIIKEEEKCINMDTHVSVSGFPNDVNSATPNSILVTEKSTETDDEYDCPMCAVAKSRDWDDDEEKAACLNEIAQSLITGCPTVVSAPNRDTAGNDRVNVPLDSVKEEVPVTVENSDVYDVKEESKEDDTGVSHDLELESPILDCEVSVAPVKKDDSIDTEEHEIYDNTSEISSYKSDIDIIKEEIYFSDQDEDAIGNSCAWFGWEQQESEADMNEDTADWETDCPSDICISEDKTEGDLHETVILSEGIQAVHPKVVDSPVQSKGENSGKSDHQVPCQEYSLTATEDKSAESDLQLAHQECSLVSIEDKSVESNLQVAHQECSPVSTKDKSVGSIANTHLLFMIQESALQVAHQECSLVSTEDKSVESDLQVAHQECSPVSTKDKSVESDLQVAHQECSPVSTKDKSVESNLQVAHQECSPVSTEDKSVESNLQVAHQESSPVSTKDKSVEADIHVKHQESTPVSTKDKSVEADLHVKPKESSAVSTEDKSVEACLHMEHQESSVISTEDKSVEADIHLEHKKCPVISTEDKSVEADLHFEHQKSFLVSTEDKSDESVLQARVLGSSLLSQGNNSDKSDLHMGQQESSPVSAEDNSVESDVQSRIIESPPVSKEHKSNLSHYFPDGWNPNRTPVVKLRRIEMTDYYKGIGSQLQDIKSTNVRKRKRKDSYIEAPPEVYKHHIPGHASGKHQHVSSETLENTTKISSQENNLSSENHGEIEGDAACNYKCSSCSDVFSSKYNLIKHVFTHIGLDAPVHICKYCGKVFSAALELQKHNKSTCFGTVQKEPPDFSRQAQKIKCKDGVNNFEAKNESSYREFTCSSCEQVFISKYCLIQHVFSHIDGVQPPSHICKLCGKILSASFSLRRHYKYGCRKLYRTESSHNGNELQEAIHYDDKNVNGDDMDKQEAAQVEYSVNPNNQEFTSNDVHDRVNGKEIYSYKCKVCGGIFRTASRLKKHFLKLCNRIDDSMQCNEVQGTTKEEIVNDDTEKRKRIVRKTTNSEFKCSTCQKVFNTEFHLEMHMTRKLKCTAPEQKDTVIDIYDRVRYLPPINDPSQHQSNIFVSSPPSSDLKISNIRVTYRMSARTGCKEKVLLCDFCDKPFKKASNLLTHRHTHTGEKYCICSICGKSYSMMGNLKRHLMSHSGEYPYSCNICNRQFKQKEHLKRHRLIHTGEAPHECHICGKCFRQSGSLQKHKVVHTGERPHQCDVCGRTFGLLGNLKQHLHTHSADRRYKCEICLKSFSRSSTLRKHSCISPGEGRRFKCNFCSKYFRTHALLKQHLAIHLGIRPYKCNICGKMFIGSGNLKIHMYIHTGEKPYVCEVCGKSFNQSSSMRRHSRVHKKK